MVAIIAPHHGQDDDEQGAHVGSDVILSQFNVSILRLNSWVRNLKKCRAIHWRHSKRCAQDMLSFLAILLRDCGSLNVFCPHKVIGRGTIRRCGLVGGGR